MYNQYYPYGTSYFPYGNNGMQNQRTSLFRKGNNFGSPRRKFNWGNFLNNTQRTLGIVNQAIPIVYQIKPILNNARTMFRIASAIEDVAITEDVVDDVSQSNEEKKENAPQFFL